MSFERCVEKAIALGDDTDTLAAMAGALCGAHLGAAGVPARWVEHLEGGPKGVTYLRTLADGLHQLHQRLAGEVGTD
jgi:poly(ADP-ribose) glycohydrolase ARH3